jgi:hypothetical protein
VLADSSLPCPLARRPIAGSTRDGQQTSTDDLDGVRPSCWRPGGSGTWLDRQGPHRTRRGRSGRVVPSGPCSFRGRAYPHGRSEPPQPAQRIPPLVASRSAWASSKTTITTSGSPHVNDSARSHRHGPGAVRVAPCPTAPGRNNLGDNAHTIDSDPLQVQVNNLSHTTTTWVRTSHPHATCRRTPPSSSSKASADTRVDRGGYAPGSAMCLRPRYRAHSRPASWRRSAWISRRLPEPARRVTCSAPVIRAGQAWAVRGPPWRGPSE